MFPYTVGIKSETDYNTHDHESEIVELYFTLVILLLEMYPKEIKTDMHIDIKLFIWPEKKNIEIIHLSSSGMGHTYTWSVCIVTS